MPATLSSRPANWTN